jgi:hypothetical protein
MLMWCRFLTGIVLLCLAPLTAEAKQSPYPATTQCGRPSAWCGWWLGHHLGMPLRHLWLARNWASVGSKRGGPRTRRRRRVAPSRRHHHRPARQPVGRQERQRRAPRARAAAVGRRRHRVSEGLMEIWAVIAVCASLKGECVWSPHADAVARPPACFAFGRKLQLERKQPMNKFSASRSM